MSSLLLRVNCASGMFFDPRGSCFIGLKLLLKACVPEFGLRGEINVKIPF